MGCWNLGQPCVWPVSCLPVLWLWPNPLLNTLSLMLPYEIFFLTQQIKFTTFPFVLWDNFVWPLSCYLHGFTLVFCFHTWWTTGGFKPVLSIFSPYHRALPLDWLYHSLNPLAFRKIPSHIGREAQRRERGMRARLSPLSACPASLLIYLRPLQSLLAFRAVGPLTFHPQ